jgi:hypothetical protein
MRPPGRVWQIAVYYVAQGRALQRQQRTVLGGSMAKVTSFGVYLSELLSTVAAYRAKWDTGDRVARRRGQLNQSAIARTIAAHVEETDPAASRSLRSWRTLVWRALRDIACPAEFLDLIVSVFAIDENPVHEARLRSLHSAVFALEGLRGPGARPDWLPDAVLKRIGRLRKHRTLSLHELHQVGPDGRARSHRTIQVLEATRPDCDRYFFVHDAGGAEVEVVRGGKVVDLHPTEASLVCVEIEFGRTIPIGETHPLELVTTFGDSSAFPPEFRRASSASISNLEVSVCFDLARLPLRVWWATWETLGASPKLVEEVQPSSSGEVHRFVETSSAPIVGFRWAWR